MIFQNRLLAMDNDLDLSIFESNKIIPWRNQQKQKKQNQF